MTSPSTGMNFGQLHDQFGQESSLLPEGIYDVTVTEAKVKSSAASSKPQIVIKFKIVDHPKESNRTLTNTFTVSAESAGAMGAFFRQMGALGFDADFFKANPENPLPVMAVQVVGRRARVKVKHEPYQGVDRARVDNVLPPVAAGAGGGLPGLPSVGTLPPIGQLMQPAPTQAPLIPAVAPAPAAPAQQPQAPTPVVAAPAPAPAPEPVAAAPAPAPAPVAAPAPAVQEQAPAPAPAAPVQEQAAPASAVPVPAPAVPF